MASRSQVSNFGSQVSNFGSQVSNSRSQVSNSRSQVSNSGSNSYSERSNSLVPGSNYESATSCSSPNLPMSRSGQRSKSELSPALSESDRSHLSSQSERSCIELILACPCGVDEETDSSLIMCDGCKYYFHANCVGLTEEDIDEIELNKPDWFCPGCLQGRRTHDSSGSFLETSPAKSARDSFESIPSPSPEKLQEDELRMVEMEYSSSAKLATPEPLSGPGREIKSESISIRDSNRSLLFVDSITSDKVDNEVIVKPGKHWRRSLSVARSLNNSRRSTISALPQVPLAPPVSEFAVPPVPAGRGARKSKRLSTRSSTLLTRQSVVPETLMEEAEEEEEVEERVPELHDPGAGNNQRARKLRPSFYIVPSEKEEASALHETSSILGPKSSDLDKLLSKCLLKKIVKFDEIYDENCLLQSRKVGEGAFGEVYLVGSEETEKPVLKVVPVGGTVPVNDEEQTGLADMMSEVVISTSLSNLRNGTSNYTEGRRESAVQWDSLDT